MTVVNDNIENKNTKCKSCGFIVFGKDHDTAKKEICINCGKIVGADPVMRLIQCDSCGQEISRKAKECPRCGDPRPFTGQFDPSSSFSTKGGNQKTKQLLGFIGSIVLFVGVFTPIVSVPIMGNINYVHNGNGDGIIVLLLAVISFVLVLVKGYKGLWFTGFGSLGVILFTFLHFQSKMSQAKADMESMLSGNPFRRLADMTMQSVQLQWGWALLIVGAVLVIYSAALKDETK